MTQAGGKERMREWLVPYRVVYRGTACVEAMTAEDAEARVEAGTFDEDPGAEMTDWECTGDAKESR